MRSILLLLAVIPTLLFAQENNKFVVKCSIANINNGKVNVIIFEGADSRKDVTEIIDSKFTYVGTTNEPLMLRFTFDDDRTAKQIDKHSSLPSKSISAWCVVYPGATVEMSGKISDFPEVYPTDNNNENSRFGAFLQQYMPLLNDLVNKNLVIYKDTTLSDNKLEEVKRQIKDIESRSMAVLNNFVKNNISSYAGLWYVGDMMMRKQLTPEEARILITNVEPKYKNTTFYKVIEKRIQSCNFTEGSTISELKSTQTPNGTTFSLTSLKGKWILLDFWGTWCGPCMSGMPYLKTLKSKFSNKLEIVGIAKDSKSAWLKCIEKDELNWIHLLNGKGDEDFVSMFNITGYPTKILIDPEGKIVYRVSGEDPQTYSKIEKLIH